MKTFTAVVVFVMMVFIGGRMVGQNLVGNGSFEDTVHCPNASDQVPLATGWENWCLTPDYFNACAPQSGPVWVSVPYNLPNGENYQQAFSGVAYAGFFAYPNGGITGLINIRDLIGRQLEHPLEIGTKYFVSIEVSLALTQPQNCACNNLGVKFTTNSYAQYANDSLTSPLVNNYAQVYSSQIITDTVNWTQISGSFIADSAYQYIVIGNFFDDHHCDTIIYDSGPRCYSYYMVDEVYVSEDSASGIKIPQSYLQVTIFPNPFTTHLQLHYLLTQPGELMVYDALGRKVKSYTLAASLRRSPSDKETFELSVAELPAGVYLVAVESGGRVWGEKVVKE